MRMNDHKNTSTSMQRAKDLRKNAPLAERLIWNNLQLEAKAKGLRFRRQQPVHPYIADFACMKARLIIELDGSSHDGQQNYDAKRDADLQKAGWMVMRFTNEDVMTKLAGIVGMIICKALERINETNTVRADGPRP